MKLLGLVVLPLVLMASTSQYDRWISEATKAFDLPRDEMCPRIEVLMLEPQDDEVAEVLQQVLEKCREVHKSKGI